MRFLGDEKLVGRVKIHNALKNVKWRVGRNKRILAGIYVDSGINYLSLGMGTLGQTAVPGK